MFWLAKIKLYLPRYKSSTKQWTHWLMVEEGKKETGGGAGDSFIFRPAMGWSTNSNLFLGRRKCRLVGEVQVGEENITIRKLAVHSILWTTESQRFSTWACCHISTMTHPWSMHHVGYKRCGKNKMRQRGCLQSLLRIWVSLRNLFKHELLLCQTDGLFTLLLSH